MGYARKGLIAAGLRGLFCASSVTIVVAAFSWSFVTALAGA
jgi:hypothetical protein